MKISQLKETLKGLWHEKLPAFVWGAPGLGKSQAVAQVAEELGVSFLDVRCLLHDPSDLKFPVVDVGERTVHWVQSIFPTDPSWEGIVFLDELDKTQSLMQGALMQPTLDRRLGDYVLPEGAWIVAAGNRQGDRAGSNRIISPLLNRFIHLDLVADADDWLSWAKKDGDIDTQVRSFIAFKRTALFNFDPQAPEAAQRAFATPRSWSALSRVKPHVPRRMLKEVAAGVVGEAAAHDFIGFLQVYDDLVTPDEVFNDPKGARVPGEGQLAAFWALCGSLVDALQSRVREGGQVAEGARCAFLDYTERMPDELMAMTVREVIATNVWPEVVLTAKGQKLMRRISGCDGG